MRYLQLSMHMIPILNILRVEREHEEDPDNENQVLETVYVHMKDGTCVVIEEETFEEICDLLNPILK